MRESAIPKPIVRVKELMEPRKRKRGHKLKRPIFMPGKHEVAVKWSPFLKTAIEAEELLREKFRALGAGEQALVSSFLCSRFSGKKESCTKCNCGEYATRCHLHMCRHMHKHVKNFDLQRPAIDLRALVKMLKTATRLIK